jgi:hypothetical protein
MSAELCRLRPLRQGAQQRRLRLRGFRAWFRAPRRSCAAFRRGRPVRSPPSLSSSASTRSVQRPVFLSTGTDLRHRPRSSSCSELQPAHGGDRLAVVRSLVEHHSVSFERVVVAVEPFGQDCAHSAQLGAFSSRFGDARLQLEVVEQLRPMLLLAVETVECRARLDARPTSGPD